MDILADIKSPWRKPGQFEGRFLVSMPDMMSDMFAETVIYMCAHSADGAIGFIINRTSSMNLLELISHAELPEEDAIQIDSDLAFSPVREGGPVDANRGFVLHGPDYETSTTVQVGKGILLTSTIQVLRAIANGLGPQQHAVMLGYASWARGQLEAEMADNTWLVADANRAMVLDEDHESKYSAALANIGITAANFVGDAGRA